MKKLKKRKDYWNDLPVDVLEKFCTIIRQCGFDTKEFIDEDGYIRNPILYGSSEPRILPESRLRYIHMRAVFDQETTIGMGKWWMKEGNYGFNVSQQRYYTKQEIEALAGKYLEKYIEYDTYRDAKLIDTTVPRLVRYVFGKGVYRCQHLYDWSKTRRACITRLLKRSFVFQVIYNIECHITTWDGVPPFMDTCQGIGDIVRITGDIRFDKKVHPESAPLKGVPLQSAFLDRDCCDCFQYRTADLPQRFVILDT